MKANFNNFNEALDYAKSLPTHTDGILNDTYQMFDNDNEFSSFLIIYNNRPIDVFRSLRYNKYNIANGFIYAAGDRLMYHRLYSRKDTDVKSVSFDIVGVKRQTTKLSAGVLISNVTFTL